MTNNTNLRTVPSALDFSRAQYNEALILFSQHPEDLAAKQAVDVLREEIRTIEKELIAAHYHLNIVEP